MLVEEYSNHNLIRMIYDGICLNAMSRTRQSRQSRRRNGQAQGRKSQTLDGPSAPSNNGQERGRHESHASRGPHERRAITSDHHTACPGPAVQVATARTASAGLARVNDVGKIADLLASLALIALMALRCCSRKCCSIMSASQGSNYEHH